jgi:hypothetical protein
MRPEEVVTTFEKEGRRVVETAGCWWYNVYHQKRIYQAFPYHRLVTPTKEEIAELFHKIPGVFAFRFLAPSGSRGKESFMWVCDGPYDLSRLSASNRSKTRRGLKHCQIRALTWDELKSLAWEAQRDTLERQGTKARDINSLGFSKQVEECPAYEAWGAFVNKNLAAYLITLWVEDWVHILVGRSANAYLKFYPNNALVFSVVQQCLSRPGVSGVNYGWESLYPMESLDQFKLSMGFTKAPVRQRIVLAPWLKPVLNPVMCRVIEKIAASRPSNQRLQRLVGFCRIIRKS